MTWIRKANNASEYINVCLVAAHLAAALPEHQSICLREQLHEAFAPLEAFAALETFEESDLLWAIHCESLGILVTRPFEISFKGLLTCLPSVVILARRAMGLVSSTTVASLRNILRNMYMDQAHSRDILCETRRVRVEQITADMTTLQQQLLEL